MRKIVLGAAALCVATGLPARAADIASAEAFANNSALRSVCHDAKRPLVPLVARLHRNAPQKASPAGPARMAIESPRPHARIALMLGIGF